MGGNFLHIFLYLLSCRHRKPSKLGEEWHQIPVRRLPWWPNAALRGPVVPGCGPSAVGDSQLNQTLRETKLQRMQTPRLG
jgi:hypothetical protein